MRFYVVSVTGRLEPQARKPSTVYYVIDSAFTHDVVFETAARAMARALNRQDRIAA